MTGAAQDRPKEDTSNLTPVERIRYHLKTYRENPDRGHDWNDYDGPPRTALLLTTVGRKSGKIRTLPLLYRKAGDRYVIIASKGGADENPGWFVNLRAADEAEIQVRHDKFKIKSRVAEGVEREELWKEMTAMHPDYDEYQTRTTRVLPVVVLERF